MDSLTGSLLNQEKSYHCHIFKYWGHCFLDIWSKAPKSWGLGVIFCHTLSYTWFAPVPFHSYIFLHSLLCRHWLVSWTLFDIRRKESRREQTSRGKERIRETVGLIQLPIFQRALVLHLLSDQSHCLSCHRRHGGGTPHCTAAWHRVLRSDNVTAGTLGN